MSNWATELVNGIAGWVEYQRALSFTRIPEGAVQLIAEKIIRAGNNWSIKSNYNCKENDILKNKLFDIAILSKNDNDNKLEVAIELKVLTSKSGKKPVIDYEAMLRDILKLTLVSKEKQTKSYFLLVGDLHQVNNIINCKRKKYHPINTMLHYNGDLEKRIDGRKSKTIYRDLTKCKIAMENLGIGNNDINVIYTQLKNKSFARPFVYANKKKLKYRTATFLWEVSHDEQGLKRSTNFGGNDK